MVEGRPADCVRLAFAELLDERPDVVVAGINQGANLGAAEMMASGTIAAAREGAFCGARAIAVSQMYEHGVAVDWSRATKLGSALIEQLLSNDPPDSPLGKGGPRGVGLWGVNLPALPPGEQPKGVRLAPLSNEPIPLDYENDGSGAPGLNETRSYEFKGLYGARPVAPGTDVEAINAGYVIVTPMTVNPTDYTALSTSFTFRLPQQ